MIPSKKAMIIDFHTHTFPDNMAADVVRKLSLVSHTRPFTDGTIGGLKASMVSAGIDRSIILPVATNPRQVCGINHSAAALNDTAGESGLWSFGCIHPDYADWRKELSRVAALGLKGIKIHPVYQGVDQDDLRYLRILDRAGELGLIVVTHGGIDIGYPQKDQCSPARIARAVRQVGPVKLVAAHMGGWKNWEEAEALLADTTVYLDTSFSTGAMVPLDDGHYRPEDLKLLDEERFLKMVRIFGAKRILFGTDSPWSGQRESLDWLRGIALQPSDRDAILGKNAQELLGLTSDHCD